MTYQYPIAFQEDKTSQITGTLTLDEPLSYPTPSSHRKAAFVARHTST